MPHVQAPLSTRREPGRGTTCFPQCTQAQHLPLISHLSSSLLHRTASMKPAVKTEWNFPHYASQPFLLLGCCHMICSSWQNSLKPDLSLSQSPLSEYLVAGVSWYLPGHFDTENQGMELLLLPLWAGLSSIQNLRTGHTCLLIYINQGELSLWN